MLLFDFDGVIADSLEVFEREFSRLLTDLGFPQLATREAILRLFEGNVIKGLVKAGFPIYRLKKLGADFAPRIARTLLEIPPFEGMPALISHLAARHPLYVITSNLTEPTRTFLALHGVRGVIDVIGADQESSKVKKIKRVRRLHQGAAAYYIGDTLGDMREAAAAGAAPVAVTWGWHPEATLLRGRPIHVVRSPEDLWRLFGGEASA